MAQGGRQKAGDGSQSSGVQAYENRSPCVCSNRTLPPTYFNTDYVSNVAIDKINGAGGRMVLPDNLVGNKAYNGCDPVLVGCPCPLGDCRVQIPALPP